MGTQVFLGTASIIKVSNTLLGLPQFGTHAFYFPLYIVFPLRLCWGFCGIRADCISKRDILPYHSVFSHREYHYYRF